MKRVGKVILIVFVVLLVLGGISSACSGRSGNTSSTNASQASSAQSVSTQSKASGQSASSADDSKTFIGTWDAIKLTLDGEAFDEAALQSAREGGVDSYIVFNDDQSGAYVLDDHVIEFTWKATSASSVEFMVDNSKATLKLNDGKLSDLSGNTVFKKGEPRPSLPPSASGNSQSSDDSASASSAPSSESGGDNQDNGEVNPDLKETLDSYEAFIDEYVEFMERYQESSDTVSMLSDYASFMQRYADFANKVENMDTSDMSTADYNYYIEVTTRCAEKTLKFAASM